jgi:hypothetical protein
VEHSVWLFRAWHSARRLYDSSNKKDSTMKRITVVAVRRYEIINHGPTHAQYFSGVSTVFTPYSSVVTGIGDNASEAYNDAVDQIYTLYGSKAEVLRLPTHPRGIRASDRLGKDEQANEEYSWHVSILFTVNT